IEAGRKDLGAVPASQVRQRLLRREYPCSKYPRMRIKQNAPRLARAKKSKRNWMKQRRNSSITDKPGIVASETAACPTSSAGVHSRTSPIGISRNNQTHLNNKSTPAECISPAVPILHAT